MKKTVLIIGGGPAGLEAARVASARGHKVVVYEKKDVVGGQLNLAKTLPKRGDIGAIVKWYDTQLRKNGVRFEFNKEIPIDVSAVKGLVDEERPDAVILATGSSPVKNGLQMLTFREVSGWDRSNVHLVDDILAGKRALEGKVLVADSTTYVEGPGISELLASSNLQVTLVTPHPQVSPELSYFNQSVYYLRRFLELGVRVLTDSWVDSIEERTVSVYHITTRTVEKIGVDHVVLNTGRRQNDGLKDMFNGLVNEVFEIGDCNVAGGRMRSAVEAGYQVGSSI